MPGGPLLSGKVALITGASSGIGAAAARHFADEGAAVVLVARRAGLVEEVAERIRKDGGRAAAWLCSDASSFTTGSALAVDGGRTAK